MISRAGRCRLSPPFPTAWRFCSRVESGRSPSEVPFASRRYARRCHSMGYQPPSTVDALRARSVASLGTAVRPLLRLSTCEFSSPVLLFPREEDYETHYHCREERQLVCRLCR